MCLPPDPLCTRWWQFGLHFCWPDSFLVVSLSMILSVPTPFFECLFLVTPHGVGLTKSYSYGSLTTCGGWCLTRLQPDSHREWQAWDRDAKCGPSPSSLVFDSLGQYLTAVANAISLAAIFTIRWQLTSSLVFLSHLSYIFSILWNYQTLLSYPFLGHILFVYWFGQGKKISRRVLT